MTTELPDICADGLTYVIGIRDGITFHDGSTMDSADVVASLSRWVAVSPLGKGVADKIASITATGDHEVTIQMSKPYSPLLSLLAFSNSAAVVYPEEIIGETIANIVGTGPYQIAEHVPDQYLQLARFDGYVPRAELSSGPAGARKQVADEIRFVPVPDPNTRDEGLLSGQFDFADGLPPECFARIEANDMADPLLLRPFGWPVFAINHTAGLLTGLKTRLALQAALPIDDMLFAAFGDGNFFVVDGPLYPLGWVCRNDAGAENYNQNNQALSGDLLKATGYDGTPFRILTSHQYEFQFKMAEVAKLSLEQAGFAVEMNVVEWATLGQQRNDPALWDIYITHSPFLPEPALTSMYSSSSRLGWADPDKEAILSQFTTDTVKRQALFAQLQQKVFEDVGFIKIGGFNALMGHRHGLTGVTPTRWPFFWNAAAY